MRQLYNKVVNCSPHRGIFYFSNLTTVVISTIIAIATSNIYEPFSIPADVVSEEHIRMPSIILVVKFPGFFPKNRKNFVIFCGKALFHQHAAKKKGGFWPSLKTYRFINTFRPCLGLKKMRLAYLLWSQWQRLRLWRIEHWCLKHSRQQYAWP